MKINVTDIVNPLSIHCSKLIQIYTISIWSRVDRLKYKPENKNIQNFKVTHILKCIIDIPLTSSEGKHHDVQGLQPLEKFAPENVIWGGGREKQIITFIMCSVPIGQRTMGNRLREIPYNCFSQNSIHVLYL